MNLYFVEKFSEGDTDAQLQAMRKVFTFTDVTNADIIFCASISKMNEAKSAKAVSGKPLVVYCWDYYKWAHDGKHSNWNWGLYANFLKSADRVLVPSSSQQLRLKELLDIDSHVVKTAFPRYTLPVSDGDFILDPVRYYPEENRDWAEKAAAKLGIPLIHSEHQYSEEEFRKLIASCTFLTSCYREASTGGLSLMEGLQLGKLTLTSNSPYQGAKDYVGPFGHYFQYDNFDDLVIHMQELWESRPSPDMMKVDEYLNGFTYEAMAKAIETQCEAIVS